MPLVTREMLRERATPEDLIRPTGYYWVQFPYPGEARRVNFGRWEPAGWDADAYSWVMLGSNAVWLTEQLTAVGAAVSPMVLS